jgi:hypothetical protein
MAFKRNVVKIDLGSYPPYLFLAPKKFGKTTFWYNLVREAWGNDGKGLLVSFGNEEGYHSLDGIQVEVAKEWNADYDEETGLRGFVQIVDDIVENNSTYGLKGICFDTFDTMVEVVTKEVLRLHKKEKGTVCKSLNDAFGGYNRGVERLSKLIMEQIERLRDIGLAVFVLCHTKMKECTDTLTGEKYEQLTNNLQSNIYSILGDAAQMVMVGAIEREIVNGKIVSENRVIYLRGTSTIDAGSRFTDLPEKIELSPKAFLSAFEEAVKKSIKSPVTDKDIEKLRKEEEKRIAEASKIAVKRDREKKENYIDDEKNIELIDIIKTKYPKASDEIKEKVKEVMANYKIENFKNYDVPTKGLEEIVTLLV